MWVRRTCSECGENMALDIEIILDATIDAGKLSIESITKVKDIRIRQTKPLQEFFEETKKIVTAERDNNGPFIDELRCELRDKYLFCEELIEDFVLKLKC